MTCHKYPFHPLVLFGSACAGAALAYLVVSQLCCRKKASPVIEANPREGAPENILPAPGAEGK